jgi:hypothetical protein
MMSTPSSFDTKEFWDSYGLTQDFVERNRLIADMIDKDVDSLIDIGSGNGIIVNDLSTRRQDLTIVTTDPSLLSRFYLNTPFFVSMLPDIPLPANRFDLVLCVQVLEHIGQDQYHLAIDEIQRLSKRYLLIGVPYFENLEELQVKCAECGFISHANGHKRSYQQGDMVHLFPGFRLVTLSKLGEVQRRGSQLGSWILHKLGRTYHIPTSFVCPNCSGTIPEPPQGNKFSRFIANRINSFFRYFSPLKPYWMICLFERKTGNDA